MYIPDTRAVKSPVTELKTHLGYTGHDQTGHGHSLVIQDMVIQDMVTPWLYRTWLYRTWSQLGYTGHGHSLVIQDMVIQDMVTAWLYRTWLYRTWLLVREPGGPTVHPPQEPSTMVPKCTLGCPKHNLTCSPDSHWDALEL